MIAFKDVSVTYDGRDILQGLSFHVAEGQKAAILGRSGLGKSSLFYLLLGFVPCHQGRVLFDGHAVNERTAWDIRKKIAFVDQDVSIGPGRAIDWIRSVFALEANAAATFSWERLKELLDYFELHEHDLDKDIGDLSGGERQRVAIIVAVMLGRKIFLFDEITSALDAHLKRKTADFFLSQHDWTIMVISHDAVWLEHPDVRVFSLEEKEWKR